MFDTHEFRLGRAIHQFKISHESNNITHERANLQRFSETYEIMLLTLALAAGLDDPYDLNIGHITTMIARFRRENAED